MFNMISDHKLPLRVSDHILSSKAGLHSAFSKKCDSQYSREQQSQHISDTHSHQETDFLLGGKPSSLRAFFFFKQTAYALISGQEGQ